MKLGLSILVVLITAISFGQGNATLSGTVKDQSKGEEIIGAIVRVKDQKLGAVTNEYGFYSNVNPSVDHPRWSQATERRIGEFFKRKTLPFNGYGEQVAGLYRGMDLRRNF